MTAEKFIKNLFNDNPNSCLYKTGDLARYLPDGNIEYLGRIDNQVKIRGFRIELGEIEAVLGQHPAVRENAVIVHEASQSDKRLVAYLVPHQEQVIENTELRGFLSERLPDYMIPSAFVTLEALPLTPNGKIDRRALSQLSVSHEISEEQFVAPRTPEEELLAGIWAEVLGIERVGVHDNFFELGGHSLLATQVMSRIRDTFKIELPLRLLFESPTVAEMAQAIEQTRQTGIVATKNVIDFNAEAVLDSTIQPPLLPPVESIAKPDAIFLTGATGFLGAYLLYEILAQTTANIYCLVRAENADEGKQRLQSKLESYLIWNQAFSSRIIPVVGELSQPLIGLSNSQFNQLASKIDVIYHNGAWVNHIYPYAVLKAANVLGTLELLKLATQTKAKPVHFISTLGVFSMSRHSEIRVVQESDIDDIQELDNGYSQSKWVAEKLMMQARDRGLPVCIYRPSRITWHSQTGITHLDDFFNRTIKGCIQLGKVPHLKFEDNLIPVDYVSRAVIHISQQTESLGKTFHLTNPRLTNYDKLFNWLRSLGYPLEQTSYTQWRSELSQQKENALAPLLPRFYQESFSDDLQIRWPQFDCQNTLKGLVDTDIVCPSIDTKLLDIYFSYLRKSGFLEVPPLRCS